MRFRTEIKMNNQDIRLDYTNKMAALGSCFTEHIGEKLERYKFKIKNNPFGVLYNPASIFQLLEKTIQNYTFFENDLVFNQNMWHCWFFDSEFSAEEKNECLDKVNSICFSFNEYLKKTDILMITYGTSFVYQLKSNNQIVSNCHKVPANNFDHILLSFEEVKKYIHETIKIVRSFNPKIQFIFSISPVRHLKDGFPENQMSKAHLVSALHSVLKEESDCSYFPAYEILLDDLRDYRFYGKDLVHPNELAIDYIWQKFIETHIDKECRQIIKELEPLLKAYEHKPFNPESKQHQLFLQNTQKKMLELENRYPFLKKTIRYNI